MRPVEEAMPARAVCTGHGTFTRRPPSAGRLARGGPSVEQHDLAHRLAFVQAVEGLVDVV